MTTLLYPATEPLAAQAPMPHRKLIRAWLTPICERSTVYALWLVLFDLVLLADLLALERYRRDLRERALGEVQ